MRNNNGTLTSTGGNDVIGGRKTIDPRYTLVESIVTCEGTATVLVDMGHDGGVLFSEEVEGPPLVTETESEEAEEEAEEEVEEESDDESMEEDEEDAELNEGLTERLRILADALSLKKLAGAFLHPEKPIDVTDGAAFGRNYFERPSAPARKTGEEANAEADALLDLVELKKAAVAYLHPEVGVMGSAPESFGRDWFRRPLAPQEEAEEAEERALALAEAAALKKLAIDYLRPEVGVVSSPGAGFGRNYFNRYSAPETEEDDLADERAEVLAENAALKNLATGYMHPEVGVTATDAALFGRNWFSRPSAPEVESGEEADERALVLAEAAALRKSAMDYLQPEVGVATTDAACSRNYFNRYSAAETDDCEDEVASDSVEDARLWLANERAEVLAEAAALKKSAMDYLHPEVGVAVRDATCGRNYFNRPSAPEVESNEDADERALVLAEAMALKKSAVDYTSPEVGVTSVAGACFGRNYFDRYSAPETEEDDLADERAEILAEAAALKNLAISYMHPEVVVTASDATLFGRNWFSRPSAPEVENGEEADERALVLVEAAALRKSAMDYMQPEVGVATTDAACSRNYFNRYSAAETDDCEDEVASDSVEDARLWLANERAEVLAEVSALKKSAMAYLHPEVGVAVRDATCGRNYFNRPSAPEVESNEDADERALVLAEAMALKKSAVDYTSPEVGVTSVAGACLGRNYFDRYSAPETEEDDLADERAEILAEAGALKNLATSYMHPEVDVTATDATLFGRNWFSRPSAPEVESGEEADERALVLVEAAALKRATIDYMHPEVGVISVGGPGFGRNYFNRHSAPEIEENDLAEERGEILAEAAALKNLAAAVKGAHLSGTKSTKFSSSDQEVGKTKKSASTVNLFGLMDGVY